MGLRDALKAKVKAALLGGAPAPAPAPARAAPPPAARPAAPAAPAVAAPLPIVAPAVAAPRPPTVGGAPSEGSGPWSAVGPSAAVAVGKPGTFAHQGAVVAVFRHAGGLYAMDNACAHEDGPIGEGAVTGTCVVCPYHDWQYDFTTGACLTDPERPRATWAVREQDGKVWLGAQLTAGSDSRGGEHDDGLEVIRS